MENARISRQIRRMIRKDKANQGGISAGSGSRLTQRRTYNSVQPMDSTSQSMTENINEMENTRLPQNKRQKTNHGVISVGIESSSSRVMNYNSVQPTDSTGQYMTEDGSSYGSDREDLPSK
ncbi:hypothetical protein SLA2020_264150 [Shorea laevis]